MDETYRVQRGQMLDLLFTTRKLAGELRYDLIW